MATKTRGATARPAAMTAAEITEFLQRFMPQVLDEHGHLTVEAADGTTSRVRLGVDDRHLRPGGTVSGPTQFYLCDVAGYVGVLASFGSVGGAVTTSANINFLKKPSPNDLVAETRILKRGRRLVVVDCILHSDGEHEPVCHAVLTYAIPTSEPPAM